ncbi:unnamed protein product [Linum trigynum]|uniref:TIR domain-containing protein n=1 Tax=Linum trigynum TaxID=586398 RepID=A0AAV2DDH0_9ROSI
MWWSGWWWTLVLSTTAAVLLPLIVFSRFLFLERRESGSGSSNVSSQSAPTTPVKASGSELSPESASLPLPAGVYEVFVSCTGPEIQNHFGDFLYNYLARSKIRTFGNEEQLPKGQKIVPALLDTITHSKLYIPILSKDYASSEWRLRELAKMVECCKVGTGHLILPIFYFVQPAEVQHQKGAYSEAFELHKKEHDEETVNIWKAALEEVGAINNGWIVTASDGQGAIVEQVYSTVWSHLRQDYLLMTDELVGIEQHVEAVVELLHVESEGVKTVGIHGMGGIGKTTIAMAVYNKVFTYFDRCSFVEDIREILAQPDGVVTLQKKIISSILNMKKDDCRIRDASEGIYMIKDRVCQHKVLIVLDNVDNQFDFGKIIGKRGDFSSGSRFIITTRDRKLLNLLQEYELYEPPTMNPENSLQLFCKHALGMDSPPEDYAMLSREIASTAAGLPLALKVVGASLFGEDKAIWEETLIQLRETPPAEVQERLKISFKALAYEEQQIFLDIACFFAGEDKNTASYMWSDCKLYPVIGINVLVLRSFIKIGVDGEIRMHDQLRDLGRAIVRDENVEPWKRSRLWSNEESLDVLKLKKGTELVKGFRVNLKLEPADQHQLTRLTNFRPAKLVILDLSGSGIKADWEGWGNIKVAENLKVLNISNCSKLTKAPDLSAHRNLEVLNLDGCVKIVQELGVSGLKNLKVLKLNNCGITKLADKIGMLQKLEQIEASWCPNLKEVPDDIGQLASLKTLIMESPQIFHLPASISKLSSLETLDLQGCLEIQEPPELPASLKKLTITSPVPNLLDLKELKELRIDESGEIKEIPRNIWILSKLEIIHLYATPNIKILPSGVGALTQLVELRLNSCEGIQCIEELPPSLKILYIGGSPLLQRLPTLENLQNLIELILSCPKLQEIPGLGELKLLVNLRIHNAFNLHHLNGFENLTSLKALLIEKCRSMENLPSLATLKKLKRLEICECPKFTEFQGLEEVESLQSLIIGDCISFEWLPNLETLKNLSRLDIYGCPRLTEIQGLGELQSLKVLFVRNCESLERLPCLASLKNISRIDICKCYCLTEIQGLGELESLEHLDLSDCTSLERLPDLSTMTLLKKLILDNCESLSNVEGLETLESLETLNLGDCQSMKRLPCLSQLRKLEKLVMNDSLHLREIESLEGLESLQKLDVSGCMALETLPDLSGLKNLKELDLSECVKLTEIRGLEELQSLKVLKMNDCKSIEKLPNVSRLKNLDTLLLSGCKKLSEVVGLEGLNLSLLDISGCRLLSGIPDFPNTKVRR